MLQGVKMNVLKLNIIFATEPKRTWRVYAFIIDSIIGLLVLKVRWNIFHMICDSCTREQNTSIFELNYWNRVFMCRSSQSLLVRACDSKWRSVFYSSLSPDTTNLKTILLCYCDQRHAHAQYTSSCLNIRYRLPAQYARLAVTFACLKLIASWERQDTNGKSRTRSQFPLRYVLLASNVLIQANTQFLSGEVYVAVGKFRTVTLRLVMYTF